MKQFERVIGVRVPKIIYDLYEVTNTTSEELRPILIDYISKKIEKRTKGDISESQCSLLVNYVTDAYNQMKDTKERVEVYLLSRNKQIEKTTIKEEPPETISKRSSEIKKNDPDRLGRITKIRLDHLLELFPRYFSPDEIKNYIKLRYNDDEIKIANDCLKELSSRIKKEKNKDNIDMMNGIIEGEGNPSDELLLACLGQIEREFHEEYNSNTKGG